MARGKKSSPEKTNKPAGRAVSTTRSGSGKPKSSPKTKKDRKKPPVLDFHKVMGMDSASDQNSPPLIEKRVGSPSSRSTVPAYSSPPKMNPEGSREAEMPEADTDAPVATSEPTDTSTALDTGGDGADNQAENAHQTGGGGFDNDEHKDEGKQDQENNSKAIPTDGGGGKDKDGEEIEQKKLPPKVSKSFKFKTNIPVEDFLAYLDFPLAQYQDKTALR
jgi:hypothetical protein